jgi:hypothetical protein
MAVPIQNLRSGTATKRPVASGLAFGQVAVNYNEADPAVYLRGDADALIKVSPVFVGPGAPNVTPASGGSAGNSKGEQWLDTASSPPAPKIFDGSAFVNSYTFASGTTLIQPLVTSGTISGSTIINATISGTFTLPSGVITSNAIANDSIVNEDINSAAAIVDTKLATIDTANKVGIAALDIDGGTDIGAALVDADLFVVDDGGAGTNRKAAASRITDYAFNKVSGDVTIASNGTAAIGSAVIVDADINASAAIAGTKIAPDFGSQIIATTGSIELGHASDTTLSRSAAGVLAVEGVVIPSISSTSTLTNKTLTDPAIIGTILEDVFDITDGAAFEIDPGNGSVQLITLGASRTPKATNMVAGEAVTLMVDDGSAYTLTWSDATFGGSGVVWKTNAGVAPTLNTTGYTVIVLWKVSTQVYGARVGDA